MRPKRYKRPKRPIDSFSQFCRVPRRISYDSAKTSVSQIIGAHARKLTDGFLQLQSHYLYSEHFCRIYRPNEKGVVESMVKFVRLNFLVPVPEVDSWKELNWLLARHCLEDLERKVRGKSGTNAMLFHAVRVSTTGVLRNFSS